MTSLSFRAINAISMLVVVGALTACASTNSGSEGGKSANSEDSSQIESDNSTVTPSQVVSPTDDVESSSVQYSEVMDSSPSEVQSEEIAGSATTGSAEPAEVIEGIAEFPEQRYEIEDSLEVLDQDESIALEDSLALEDTMADEDAMSYEEPMVFEDSAALEDSLTMEDSLTSEESVAMESDSDSDIDRLRDELAASESELERIRAEEAERDFAASLARSASADDSNSGSAVDDQTSDAPSHTATAQAAGVPKPGARASDLDLAGKPAEYSIYFEYNQATLENGVESVIAKHVQFMRQNPDIAVEIQGNCDERGSREYNIALGERRARTVKRALELLGIEGSRIGIVSFGAEKPIAFGRDEESYRLNRRADIVY